MPANWSQALQGQVAGLNVISAGGPLSSTQINLRGNVSMNMDGNGALIVVDGVPLSSPMNNPGGFMVPVATPKVRLTLVMDSLI